MLIPVLLAGGVGTRLWPASRQSRPKQFLPLAGDDQSLLRHTLERLHYLSDVGDVLTVGNEEHRFALAGEMQAAGYPVRIILEPAPRSTAAAVAAAALDVRARHGDQAVMLVLPTDHTMIDPQAFATTVARVRQSSGQRQLALLGVKPDRPETGYGYIQTGSALGDGLYTVESFVEKPDEATARDFLAAGHYYWNSGILVFRAGDYLELLAEYAGDIFDGVTAAYEQAIVDRDFLRLDKTLFEAVRADSVDYAVMEKTDRAVMAELDAAWADLGSWTSVARALGPDSHGNSRMGDVWLEEAERCVVHSEGRLVVVLGTRDKIIVETADTVLVADRAREQEIRALVARLAAAGRREATDHSKTYRPWGSYRRIAAGERFQVKHIRVAPGGQLSLQSHHHRAEHWIVVRGTARVMCDEADMLLTENQSTYIPLGAVHRLENPGKVELELIEVQSGSYLGEDDIIRYDDVYGRSCPSEN